MKIYKNHYKTKISRTLWVIAIFILNVITENTKGD